MVARVIGILFISVTVLHFFLVINNYLKGSEHLTLCSSEAMLIKKGGHSSIENKEQPKISVRKIHFLIFELGKIGIKFRKNEKN